MENLRIILYCIEFPQTPRISVVLTNAKLYPIGKAFERTMNIVKRFYLGKIEYIFLNYCQRAIQFQIVKPCLPSTRDS